MEWELVGAPHDTDVMTYKHIFGGLPGLLRPSVLWWPVKFRHTKV